MREPGRQDGNGAGDALAMPAGQRRTAGCRPVLPGQQATVRRWSGAAPPPTRPAASLLPDDNRGINGRRIEVSGGTYI